MLHGEIKVNDTVIGEWQAVRQTHDLRDTNNYECRMTYRNKAGYPMEAAWIIFDHNYNDGAAMLAARVLYEGMRRLRVKPMTRDEETVDLFARRIG